MNITPGKRLAILGANGMGKSTLVQIIAGIKLPSEGKILWKADSKNIEGEDIYRSVSFAAPYMELIEEFTLKEHIRFHFSLKKALGNLNTEAIIELSGMKDSSDKMVRYFSSGMKQRLRLLLAIISDTPILILDEPSTNLDQEAVKWYLNLIREFSGNRTIIVASNHQLHEYGFCENNFVIE